MKRVNWIQVHQEGTQQPIVVNMIIVKLLDSEGDGYILTTCTIVSLSEKKSPLTTSYIVFYFKIIRYA